MDDALHAQSAVASAMAEASLARADPPGALVYAVEALRLAVLAVAVPDDPGTEHPEDAPWARVELFGHAVRVGIIREVQRYGRRWLEVTQPALWREPPGDDPGEPDLPATVKLYHPNAVYAIDEYEDAEEARQANRWSRGVHWPDDPREF